MALPVTKEQREIAKAEKKVLIQLSIDTRPLSDAQKRALKGKILIGQHQMTGPVSVKEARELWDWSMRHLRKGR